MTATEYQEAAARMMPSTDTVEAAKRGVLGLGIGINRYREVSEGYLFLLDHPPSDPDLVEKHSKRINATEEYIREELGDCWQMLAEICTAFDIKLEELLDFTSVDYVQLLEGVAHVRAYLLTFLGDEIDMDTFKPQLKGLCKTLDWICQQFGGTEEIWEMNIDKLTHESDGGYKFSLEDE